MTPATGAFLFCAAAIGGGLNSVAGGGSFVAFPALLFAGVPAIPANATNSVALWPGSAASAIAYRRELREVRSELLPLGAAALVGGLCGSLLLLRTPERSFVLLIPWLLLCATVLFSLGGVLRSKARNVQAPLSVAVVAQLGISIYGGYFGGGMGIMMLAVLSLLGMSDIHRMNAIKTVLATLVNGIAVAAFIVAGAVQWAPGAVMIVGGVTGGYAGATIARRVDAKVVRALVLVIAWGMTVYFFVRTYGSSFSPVVGDPRSASPPGGSAASSPEEPPAQETPGDLTAAGGTIIEDGSARANGAKNLDAKAEPDGTWADADASKNSATLDQRPADVATIGNVAGSLDGGDDAAFRLCPAIVVEDAAAASASSCHALLDVVPSLPNGVYPLDLDGNGPSPSLPYYCDMSDGGWTLVANQVPDAPLPDSVCTVNLSGFGDLRQSYRLGVPDVASVRPSVAWKLTDATNSVYFRPACVVDWTINYDTANPMPTVCTTGYTDTTFANIENGGWVRVSARGIGINDYGASCSIRMYESHMTTTGTIEGTSLPAGVATPCLYAQYTSQRVSLWLQ